MKMQKNFYILYSEEVKDVYNILNDESIEDKMEAIKEKYDMKRFKKSLEYKFYQNIDKELEFIKSWYNDYLNRPKPKFKDAYDKRVKALIELNKLYMNNKLNEDTFYPIYYAFDRTYNLRSVYTFLKKNPNLDMSNKDIKSAFNNLDKILDIVDRLTTGDSLRYLETKREYEMYFDKNKYLDNYQYAEFIINDYINDPVSFRSKEFLKKHGIDDKAMTYVISLIKSLNPVLYGKYLIKKEENRELRHKFYNEEFKKLATDIKKYELEDKDMPLEEFFKRMPLDNIIGNFKSKLDNAIFDNNDKMVISNYVIRNRVKELAPINYSVLYNSMIIICGKEASRKDFDMAEKLLKIYDLPINMTTFKIMLRRYMNNEFKDEEIIDNYNKALELEEMSKIKNPYNYTDVEAPVKKLKK